MGGDEEEGVDTEACLLSGHEGPSQDAYILHFLAVTKGHPSMVPGRNLGRDLTLVAQKAKTKVRTESR